MVNDLENGIYPDYIFVNVLKKRRKFCIIIICENDYKMIALDFFGEMKFNIHKGYGTRLPLTAY